MAEARRIEWIDSWKGLLIFLVVLGHAVGGASHLTAGNSRWLNECAYRVIYSFHMSAFFFIAGLLWHDSGAWGGMFLNGFAGSSSPTSFLVSFRYSSIVESPTILICARAGLQTTTMPKWTHQAFCSLSFLLCMLVDGRMARDSAQTACCGFFPVCSSVIY